MLRKPEGYVSHAMRTESKENEAEPRQAEPERQGMDRKSSPVLPRTMDIGIDAGR